MAKFLYAFLVLLTIQYVHAASIPPATTNFRWCALPKEQAKCADFIKYVNMTAQNLNLDVTTECVVGSSADDCINKIDNNQADLVTLDGRKVYDAGNQRALIPIVSEQYGQYSVNYYSVAVVKVNTVFGLKTGLRGKKSCHTGARRTTGWNVPIGYLLRARIMPAVACGNNNNDFMSASKFFNKSCVPGVDSSKFTNLCALCAGQGVDKCSTDQAKNTYADYIGAFKCMGDGAGDVAFVKHTTTQEVVKGGGYGNVADYEYLCKDGTRKPIGMHEDCNLGYNPAHAVVTRKGRKGNAGITNIIKILTKMSDLYGATQQDWTKFQMFNSTGYVGSDLMFKDSTTELKGIASDKQIYERFLGDDFVKDLEALISCASFQTTSPPTPSKPPIPSSVTTVTSPITELVMLIALISISLL